MTPNELYRLPVVEVRKDIGLLLGFRRRYTHLPELEDMQFDGPAASTNERVEIRVHKEQREDWRRFWLLASVWFDGQPVMAIQNAGREGDDWNERYITDAALYTRMIAYVSTLRSPPTASGNDVVDPNTDILHLTKFYSGSL